MDKKTVFWSLLGILFFIPFLGGVHLFDWDEINFAEIAREMVVSGDWLKMQINYAVFTEKPPFFFWMQAASMSVFGVGEYAARFPNALLGVLVLPFLYRWGKRLVDSTFGFLWAMSWFGSILPFLYFKSGIIDPFFNFFIFNGLLYLILAGWKGKEGYPIFRRSQSEMILIAGIFAGLGILTKGPVAYLLIFLAFVAFNALRRFRFTISPKRFIGFSLVTLLVFLLWFAVDLIFRGPDFLIEFTIRQWELLTTGDAGHSGFIGYHFVVLFFGCFPASIFAIGSLRRNRSLPSHIEDFRKWMSVLFWVVLILFSLVGTKIIHYSSMAYYPLTFLSALSLWSLIKSSKRVGILRNVGVAVVGFIILAASFALPYMGMHPDLLMPLLEADPFATANMEAEVTWSAIDYLPAAIIAITLVTYFALQRRSGSTAFRTLFFGTGIWVFTALIFFIGKVESISQRASVEFFESQVGEEVYVTTYGYKSYVPWFYAKVQPYEHEEPIENRWLLHGETDRPVMISVKINKVEEFRERVPDAQLLYAKNGFYFFERPAFSK